MSLMGRALSREDQTYETDSALSEQGSSNPRSQTQNEDADGFEPYVR